ncbi:MAG: hypothetical protein GY795_38210 [Desulfobacterales bacterium]|nr:hypothetical protein [Desulfobacterales bacterium]
MKPLQEWIYKIFENPPLKVLFRADAGRVRGLSFGHASRCLILAKVLQEQFNTESLFLMRYYQEGVTYVRSAEKQVVTIPSQSAYESETRILERTIQEFQPDWLIIDLPYTDTDLSYISLIRSKRVKVLFIDDSRFEVPPVDVYLNSSILTKKKIIQPTEGNTRFFLGPEYFIFDESLLKHGPVRKDGYFNVVITFGGSDPTGLTLDAIKSLQAKDWPGILFRIILGPGYKDIEETEMLVKGKTGNFQIVHNPKNLISYMLGCDIAVCAGGRTMYELIYLGKSFIPIPSAKHEEEPINEVRKLNLNLLDNNNPLTNSITTMLLKIGYEFQD